MKERKRNRLRGFDYSSDNLYFITSCVHDRVCCFGEIQSVNDDRNDNGTNGDGDGGIVVGTGRDLSLRQRSRDYFPRDPHSSHPRQKMILNEYGIIAEQQWDWLEDQYPYIVLHAFVVMPNHAHGIIEIKRPRIPSSESKIKSLSELMGAYKTTVSKKIHLLGYTGFTWQRSFYEHIIRDERSFETISDYIINNPLKWEQDKFFNT